MPTDIFQKNWLIARQLDRAIEQAIKNYAREGLLLDAGCGGKPYARFLAGRRIRHIGLDMGSTLVNEKLDVYGQITSLPFKDEIFSTILCTESLQYIPDPRSAMLQFHRALVTGGIVILTTTQMWHVTNAPFDCYRFTEYGLRHLALSSGFTVHYHKGLGGFWLRMGLKFCYFIHRFAKVKMLNMPIRLLLVPSQLFFSYMDTLFFDPKDIINHIVILRKD